MADVVWTPLCNTDRAVALAYYVALVSRAGQCGVERFTRQVDAIESGKESFSSLYRSTACEEADCGSCDRGRLGSEDANVAGGGSVCGGSRADFCSGVGGKESTSAHGLCGERNGLKASDRCVQKGKHYKRNQRKKEKRKGIVKEKTELQLSLERKWQAENELALERAKKDLEYQRARDVVAEVTTVKERRKAAQVQFAQRNYKFEEWAANRKKITQGFAKTVVSGSSASSSPRSPVSGSLSGSHVNSKASSPVGSRGEFSALSSLSGNSTSTNREKVLESTMRRMQACIDAKDKKISELTKELRYEIVNSDCSY